MKFLKTHLTTIWAVHLLCALIHVMQVSLWLAISVSLKFVPLESRVPARLTMELELRPATQLALPMNHAQSRLVTTAM